MTNADLDNCPHCGQRAQKSRHVVHRECVEWRIACVACPARMTVGGNEADACKAWNRRVKV